MFYIIWMVHLMQIVSPRKVHLIYCLCNKSAFNDCNNCLGCICVKMYIGEYLLPLSFTESFYICIARPRPEIKVMFDMV